MHQNDIELISDFIDGMVEGKHQFGAFTEGEDIRELEILKKRDLMWKICTILIAFKDANFLKLVGELLSLTQATSGAGKFAGLFVAELFGSNVGLSSVPRGSKSGRKKIRPSDTSDIKENLTQFKMELQKAIDNRGGITALAKKAKMSQPSLSRMMNSDAVPRRQTLVKIFEILGIEHLEI